jgi:hypothetical protein
MPVAFYRPGQMNGQSGVQLNRLVDQSGMPDAGYASQSAATAVRATRGRIDRANAVTSASVFRRLGRPQPIRQSQLNEGLEQVMEAVSNGAYQVVTARLHSAAAKIKWGVARYGVGAVLSVAVNASGGVDAVTVTDGGTGYQPGSTLPVQFSGGSGAVAWAPCCRWRSTPVAAWMPSPLPTAARDTSQAARCRCSSVVVVALWLRPR